MVIDIRLGLEADVSNWTFTPVRTQCAYRPISRFSLAGYKLGGKKGKINIKIVKLFWLLSASLLKIRKDISQNNGFSIAQRKKILTNCKHLLSMCWS
jgi:hypothetical protein